MQEEQSAALIALQLIELRYLEAPLDLKWQPSSLGQTALVIADE